MSALFVLEKEFLSEQLLSIAQYGISRLVKLGSTPIMDFIIEE